MAFRERLRQRWIGEMIQVIRDRDAHEQLILEAIVAVCRQTSAGAIRNILLEQLADMLVKINNPPRMLSNSLGSLGNCMGGAGGAAGGMAGAQATTTSYDASR